MLRFRRATVAVLILLTFWPTLVFGQASKAGIITTLEGRATAARVVLPNPVALHFKDDVFLNDEITTAEKSLARILLGGKAVVTIRERSSLTITEVPGLSTIDIASGKIAMAVAREKLRPGEQIQIRTPNAITGIRGTSLIVEVIRSIADTKRPDPNAITRLGVFDGNVDVQHIHPVTRAPLAPAVNVAINTKFSAAGTQPAAVAAFAPGDSASFQQGVTPSGPQHVQAANEQQLAGQAQETANALLTALGTGPVVAQTPNVTPTPVVVQPRVNESGDRIRTAMTTDSGNGNDDGGASPSVPSNIVVDPQLRGFIASPVGASLVTISGAVSTDGTAFTVQPSTPVPADLNLQLLTANNGDLTVNGQVLDVVGSFSSTTPAPLVSFDPTTATVTGDFMRIGPTGNASVAGALLSDIGGTLTVGGSVVNVTGGTLRATGTDPLIQLNGTTLNVGGALLKTIGGGAAPNVTINGSLVRAVDSTLRLAGLPIGPGTGGLPAIFETNFGSILTSPNIGRCDDCSGQIGLGFSFPFRGQSFSNVEISTNGFLSLGGVNGAACCNADITSFLNGAPRIAVAWYDLHPSAIGGGLKFAAFPGRAVFTWDAVPEFPSRGSNTIQMQLLADGRIVFGYGPIASVTHTVIVGITQGGGTANPGERDFSLGSFSTGAQPTVYEFFDPNTIDLSGQNLVFTPNGLGGWDVSSSAQGFGGVALALLDGSTVNQTGSGPLVDLLRSGISAGQLLQVSGGSTLALSGTLLRSQGGALSFSGDFAQITGAGSTLTSTASDPLIAVSGGSLSVGGRLLAAENGATVSLRGPLAEFTGLSNVSDASVLALVDGAALTTTSTDAPLLRFTGTATNRTTVASSRNLVALSATDGTVARPSLSLSGPLLGAIFTNFTTGNPLSDPRSFVFVGDGGRLQSVTANPLITLDTSVVNASASLVSVRRSAGLLGEVASTVSLAGPLLSATTSQITASSTALTDAELTPILCCNLLTVGQGARMTSDSGAPLIDLVGTPVTVGDRLAVVFAQTSLSRENPVAFAPASLVLAGPLLRSMGESITGMQALLGIFESAVASTTGAPLIDLNGTAVTMGGPNPLPNRQDIVPGRLIHMSALNGAASLILQGPLFNATNAIIRTTADAFSVFNGATLTSTTADPLISITGGSVALGPTGSFFGAASVGGPSSVSLRGSLLLASNTTITNGDPTRNTQSFMFVGDGSTVRTRMTDAPLLEFRDTTVDTAGNIVTLRRSALTAEIPSRITLSGPLLLATNSQFNTTSLGLSNIESACCSGFFIGEGAELSSTSTLPLITLTGGNFNAGPDAQSGGTFFFVSDTSGGNGGQPAPSTVTLAGPWLRAVDSIINAQFSLFDISRSTVTSSSVEPLVQMEGATVNVGGSLTRVVDGQLLAATVPALANLIGNTRLTTGSTAVDVVGANANVELRDVVRLTNSIMTVANGHLVNVNAGRLNVTGNLVSLAGNSTLNVLNGLLLNMIGGSASIGGAVVNFTGAGNTINVTNTFQPNFFARGIPFFVGPNTPNPVVSTAQGYNPLVGVGTNGTLNVNGSLIAVQNGATLRIGP